LLITIALSFTTYLIITKIAFNFFTIYLYY